MKIEDCELAIIGSGASGLISAIRAREQGVKRVIILEKAPRTGGNSRAAGGMFAVNGKKVEETGLSVDIQKFYSGVLEELRYTADHNLVRKYIFHSGKAADWLAEKGVPMELRQIPTGAVMFGIDDESLSPYTHGAPTTHSFFGTALVNRLTEICCEMGVDIFLSSPVQRLLLDESGAVSGVLVKNGEGQMVINAKAVIIAAGGVAGSVATLHKYFPHVFDLTDENFTFGSAYCTGDGIEMAEEAGADTRRAMGILLKGPSHLGPGGTQAVTYSEKAVIINNRGRRFINESRIWNNVGSINSQPQRTTFTIVDEKIKDIIKGSIPQPQAKPGTKQPPVTLDEGLRQEAEKGKDTCIAHTWKEASEFIGVPEDVLCDTIERYNRFCSDGEDLDLSKPAEHLIPIDTPPYYVLRGVRSTDSTYGGIRINEEFAVLKKDGLPISGLFAAGDNATGFVSDIYAPGGAGFTWSICSGHLAGGIAAEKILNKEKGEG